MEINKYTDIIGVVTGEDIPEGRMVILTSHDQDYDFGSKVDLPGVRLPADSDEALDAKYCLTWPVSNANAEGPIKMFIPTPSFAYALRSGGWDQTANVPFSATVHLTYPGHKEGVTIPSGYQALAFDRGVFTVPSGHFIYAAGIVTPGAKLEVLNKADDGAANAGLLSYTGTVALAVAVVERFELESYSLTFRTL